MSRQTAKGLLSLGLTLAALVVYTLAAMPVFPQFYHQYLDQGMPWIEAFCYALSSSFAAARWISIPIILVGMPLAMLGVALIKRFCK